jgi:sugar phosphate isomerase/epimerase
VRAGRPPEAEFLRHMRHAAESLDAVAAFCAAHKMRLLLENMLPHLLFGHVSDMLYLLGEIHHRQVGACLDTGHAFLSGDLPMVANKLSGHLKMVHVNDNHGDWDSHLPPGEGRIDWHHLMGELSRQHFHGAFILETGALEGESMHHTLARIRRGRDYLEKTWAGAFTPIL